MEVEGSVSWPSMDGISICDIGCDGRAAAALYIRRREYEFNAVLSGRPKLDMVAAAAQSVTRGCGVR